MPPKTSRDFQRAALQRLGTAEFLLNNTYTLDAQYLAGYTVECSLKALILEVTPVTDRADQLKNLYSGAKMHRPEVLLDILRTKGIRMPLILVRRFRRFVWSTDLRYETGRRDKGETRAFLKTAQETYEWVEKTL